MILLAQECSFKAKKKKKQPTRKTLQYTEMKLPDFGVYPFFP